MQGQGKVRQGKTRPWKGQSKVKERSRKGQSKVKVTSRQCKIKIKVRSKQGQDNIKRRSRQGQGNVKRGSSQGQGKAQAWSRQRKHNLDRKYNLMGFDIIEINLVWCKYYHPPPQTFLDLQFFLWTPLFEHKSFVDQNKNNIISMGFDIIEINLVFVLFLRLCSN